MKSPADCRFLESHEWHKLEGDVVTLGVSKYAVDELTDITYVQLPEVGARFSAGDSIGEIESVKATSDLYTGISGEVVEVNDTVVEDPSLVNNDPFGGGWLVKLKAANPSELDGLIDAASYDDQYPVT